MCIQGECTANVNAPIGDCVLGDDVIINSKILPFELPSTQMNCQSVIDFVVNSRNEFPSLYCNTNPSFRSACCNTCKSIKISFLG
jgi:hypothetical protein